MMQYIDPFSLAGLKTWARDFAEARFQLAILDGESPGIVYEGLDPKKTYADALRSTTFYDEETIESVSRFAQDAFRERWAEMENLHSATSASDRPQ